jgi:ABC-type phosphate transport system permease subunit
MALTLLIVLVFTATVLLARGRWVAALVLAVLALPVLALALRRMRRNSGQ